MKILRDKPDGVISEEEKKFWAMDEFDDLVKEVQFYRTLCGDSYRILNKPKKTRLSKKERLMFFAPTEKKKRLTT